MNPIVAFALDVAEYAVLGAALALLALPDDSTGKAAIAAVAGGAIGGAKGAARAVLAEWVKRKRATTNP